MTITTTRVLCKWTTGGGMMPIYRGQKTISVNHFTGDGVGEILDKATRQAKGIIARDGCFDLSLVKITDAMIVGKRDV